MRVILAKPRGFCAGVVRAVEIVESALEMHGAPVHVRHEIVHNAHVVRNLAARGAVFVSDVDDIPTGAVTIFSAHGVSPAVVAAAQERNLRVTDATCPLVRKVHLQARRYLEQGRAVVLIGHAGHPEVEGTLGQVGGQAHLVETVDDVGRLPLDATARVAYVTQTTLSVDDTRMIIDGLESRFADIVGPDTRDICYATQNRQASVRELARQADLILVVGSRNSSNSNRLREIAEECGVESHLIEDGGELDPAWLTGVAVVGVTAGASAPEHLVTEVIDAFRRNGPVELTELAGPDETVRFRMPPEFLPH